MAATRTGPGETWGGPLCVRCGVVWLAPSLPELSAET